MDGGGGSRIGSRRGRKEEGTPPVRLERRRGDREEDDAATTRLQPPSPACTRRPAVGGDLPFFSPSPSPPSCPGGLGTAAPGHLPRRLGRRRWRRGAADRGGATSLDGLSDDGGGAEPRTGEGRRESLSGGLRALRVLAGY
jgi:hypothetical protein